MSETQWFYEQRGERKGPVIQSQLEELLVSQQVGPGTLVWRTGFADWVQLGSTELAPVAAGTPPPLTSAKISDLLVWLIALSPVIGVLIGIVSPGSGPYTGAIIFIVVACIDIGKLRKAGYAKPAMWSVLLPFLYLCLRSRALNKSQAPLVVWGVLMLLLFAADKLVHPVV
ncbi:DUF4339 domain-containing protein [Pseudomonas sp. DSP3-2-2]|uniref:DUF4339 domain-containing protein n=1 Tax=unclassified Pseudomonas TaxID=196821 RepID=UPI003CE8FC98